jgi:hypothetical protein
MVAEEVPGMGWFGEDIKHVMFNCSSAFLSKANAVF